MSRVLRFFLMAFAAVSAPASHAAPARVLFVADELLDSADIPASLAAVAKAMGREVEVKSVSVPSANLEDLARDERVQAALAGGWTWIVMEQPAVGPSDDRARFIASAKRLAGMIRAKGAKPALFMTWPPGSQLRDLAYDIVSARAAAQASDAVLVPVGEAWYRVLTTDKRAHLYSGDTRPSPHGSQLAVLTLWFALFPAGYQEFDDAYAKRLADALAIDEARRDPWIDAATRAIDEPLPLK